MGKRALRLFPILILSTWLAACGDDGGGSPDAAVCVPVNDNNSCTTDVCENGSPVHNPVTPGTDCATGSCNAAGMCVAATCEDGFENGDETDLDCGGSCAPTSTCETGEGCAVAADCESGVCGAGNTCTAPACGDGVMQSGEMCDDGNMTNGDGCDDGTGGTCRPTGCGNGTTAGTEACDDGNMTNGDGCDNNCTATACGNGVTAGAETCDDGGTSAGDGCGATCAIETGFMCTTAVPSVCTSICGDGIVIGGEACDDMGTAGGDGCSTTCTVEAGYVCTGMPSVCARPCGNGTVEAGEQCDDGNMTAGDGCSATCQIDITCAAGSTPVIISNATSAPIPDNMAAGVLSPVTVATTGAVTKATVYVTGITHTNDAHVDMFLVGPTGRQRTLSDDNGAANDNYARTLFDDAATTAITSGTAPFTGRFRSEQSLSTTATADFLSTRAAGVWNLKVADDTTGETGTLDGWTLAMCVDPAAPYCGDTMVNGLDECDDGNLVDTDTCSNACLVLDGCGDGNIDAGEQCDDNNILAGDGCGPTCQLDAGCVAGETAVIVTNNTPTPVPDNDPTLAVSIPVTVAPTGAVTRVTAYIADAPHTWAGDYNFFLVHPSGLQRELSTGNGSSTDNYTRTFLDDGAATAITSGSAPFTGRFRPEQSLSTTAGLDFRGLNAAGVWNLRVFDSGSGDTGTVNSWSLLVCVNPTAGYCGDTMVGPGEECDDGNTDNTDACSNGCQITDGCGDGNLDAGEACDDNNLVSGDGCSATTCQFDIACGAGETPVIVTNSTPAAFTTTMAGAYSTSDVTTAGVVRRVIATVNITYSANGEIDLFLRSPWGVQRELASERAGANFTQTIFSDTAAQPITAGTAPFTGAFRGTQTLSDAAGFGNQTAFGTWTLHAAKDTTPGQAGTINSWTLAVCVDPSVTAVCGNGAVEAAETCDDLNVTAGDGCSATCQVELTCPTGSSPLIARGAGLPLAVPDNNPVGVTSVATVTATGTVAKAVVVLGTITHQYQSDLDIFLVSPMGTEVDLVIDPSTSNDDFVSTILDDAATVAVSAIPNGGRGRFRPSETPGGLSIVNTQLAAGAWTLKVVDDTNVDTGDVVSWTIGLCVTP